MKNVEEFSNVMDIEFEEYRSPEPQEARGFNAKAKKILRAAAEANDQTSDADPKLKRPSTWDSKVKKDLSKVCQDQLPPTPVVGGAPIHHREKNRKRHWPCNACVARPVTKKELYATPAALASRD